METQRVWVGTSGWVYKEWAGHFYPKGWPKKDEFDYYVQHFPTVEINATFYRLPTLNMVRGWRDKAPSGFVFAAKGSRFLTHIKRLKDTGQGLNRYFQRLDPLRSRTGPILWQLPPSFPKTEDTLQRVEQFLLKLPKGYRHAVEFRHPSWIDKGTMEMLRRYQVANVWLSSLRMPFDATLTTDFAYLRFHGLAGGPYHDYTDVELKPWAHELSQVARQGLPAYVYFNNDLNTQAPLNAKALMAMLDDFAVRPLSPREHVAPAEAATTAPAERSRDTIGRENTPVQSARVRATNRRRRIECIALRVRGETTRKPYRKRSNPPVCPASAR